MSYFTLPAIVAIIIMIEALGIAFIYLAVKYELRDDSDDIVIPDWRFESMSPTYLLFAWPVPLGMWLMGLFIRSLAVLWDGISMPPNPFNIFVVGLLSRAKKERQNSL